MTGYFYTATIPLSSRFLPLMQKPCIQYKFHNIIKVVKERVGKNAEYIETRPGKEILSFL
jgi:hypothetical protein